MQSNILNSYPSIIKLTNRRNELILSELRKKHHLIIVTPENNNNINKESEKFPNISNINTK